MPDVPGFSDPDEVKRARSKFVTIMRYKWRLHQRLATIDWEADVLTPQLRAFEKTTTVVGELPKFEIEEAELLGPDQDNLGE
jgi:hypothetical protein